MAESSIFHNVILDTPEKVEAFINAAEASLAHPYVRPEGISPMKVITDSQGHTRYTWEITGR